MSSGWYITQEGLDRAQIRIGDTFFFEGDWQVPEGTYEVVHIHKEPPMQIDARFLGHPKEIPQAQVYQAQVYEGFWAKTVIQGKAVRGNRQVRDDDVAVGTRRCDLIF